jgi:hypothetical protein
MKKTDSPEQKFFEVQPAPPETFWENQKALRIKEVLNEEPTSDECCEECKKRHAKFKWTQHNGYGYEITDLESEVVVCDHDYGWDKTIVHLCQDCMDEHVDPDEYQ